MPTSKYYGPLNKKTDKTETTTTESTMPAQTANLSDPALPIGQPGLATALDRIADVIDRKLASIPVTERDFSVLAEPLSNEEEWKACDNALDRDHVKVDANGRDCDQGNYYKVIHNYPMYQSSNSGENIAFVVVEKWTFVEDGAGGKRRQKLGSFNMKFRDFHKQYKTALAG